jgi:hypothetical protein
VPLRSTSGIEAQAPTLAAQELAGDLELLDEITEVNSFLEDSLNAVRPVVSGTEASKRRQLAQISVWAVENRAVLASVLSCDKVDAKPEAFVKEDLMRRVHALGAFAPGLVGIDPVEAQDPRVARLLTLLLAQTSIAAQR